MDSAITPSELLAKQREGAEPRHPLLRSLERVHNDLHDYEHQHKHDNPKLHHHHGPDDYDILIHDGPCDNDASPIIFNDQYGPAFHDH